MAVGQTCTHARVPYNLMVCIAISLVVASYYSSSPARTSPKAHGNYSRSYSPQVCAFEPYDGSNDREGERDKHGNMTRSHQKFMTWMLTSRNDRYNGFPMKRLSMTLKVLASRLQDYKFDHEILVVDYNSEIPHLMDSCDDPIPRALQTYLRNTTTNFVIVPPVIVKKESDVKFNTPMAVNVGARYAEGEMLAQIDQDTMPGRQFFEWMRRDKVSDLRLYTDRWWWSGRRDTFEDHRKSIEEDCEKFLDDNGRDVKPWGWPDENTMRPGNNRCGMGATGIFVVPRAMWHMLCGYDENFKGWGHMEWDFTHNHLMYFLECLNLDDPEYMKLQKPFYHIWHERGSTPAGNVGPSEHEVHRDWGLRTYSFNKITCRAGECRDQSGKEYKCSK